ncbi:glycosyltransferase involved in cell wall biosynthesis [Geodermatophilus bullaregiensis]|uniref:glycosyltransferase family 4 protein n=1 Tax=Geodermatophilus bullaregiensis TaxID=1564160 RepID=UPI00195BC982|nr:glycosyltransferase family 4 protein [Geodermatophilus bullaregiensis]MBM7807026.1 glycosyltransferase involved in cell wall biosynthesis [Geodermatophilus bullaregiensis]
MDDPAFHGGGPGREDERRTDFTLITERLAARNVDLGDVRASRLARLVQALAGDYAALAVVAFRRRDATSAYFSSSENEAIVLALLLRLARRRIPVVAIGHYPAKTSKWVLWRWLRLHEWLYRLMPLGSVQAERLTNGLGVPPAKVEVLPLGIDTRYWDPARATTPAPARPYVFAAGLQHRDYRTLVRAVDGLGVDLLIGAASPWATTQNALDGEVLPSWVRIESPDVRRLRDCYAGAAVVVTPVVETDFPAGTTAVLEGMAMRRPVVVTRVEGTGDHVADRRKVLRKGPARQTSGVYAARYGSLGVQGQTGFFYPPGDADELRSILRYVLDHPAETAVIAARARRVVEEVHSLEGYVDRIVGAVRDGIAEWYQAGAHEPAREVPPSVSEEPDGRQDETITLRDAGDRHVEESATS